MISKLRLSALMLGMAFILPSMANDPDEAPVHSDSVALNYVGDDIRIGIGYDTETDITGEIFWTFGETADSAWIAEGWFGDESSGGLKLNYHWLKDGVEGGLDMNGETVYSEGRVRKLFLAADQNIWDDNKVTFGGGGEHQDHFWSLYGSLATSGERYLGQVIDTDELLFTGIMDNHEFSRTDILETITDFYAHPYDWGVGFRLGRYFDNSLVRLRAGIDYESGDYDSSQTTASAILDKRFKGTGHGLSLRAEVLRKHGDFEVDRNDIRLGAFWTWDFGASYQPAAVYREVPVERIPDPSELPREQVVEMVRNKVTLDNTASFALDSHQLNDAARSALGEVVRSLKGANVVSSIRIVGHTCSLGTDEYNQVLSERRARTVFDFLAGAGIDTAGLKWEGHGESEPRYSNDTEETRARNRRVEVSFTAEEEVVHEVIVGEGQPITEWVQEKVPVEAAWIRRALRNPVAHKRSVDYYRINRQSERYTTGETIFENSGPDAVNDMYSIDQDSGDRVFNVLANDSDPEGDTLTIVSVSSPAHGVAAITGDTVTYTADTGYYGSDSFSYTIEDGYGGSATAMVAIGIARFNEAPTAADDHYTVLQESGANALDVLANDGDPDGDTLTITGVTTPAHGTALISGNTIMYTPDAGFYGSDTFGYTVEDGFGGSAGAQVSITVEALNVPPSPADDMYTVLGDSSSNVFDVLANDSDIDGDVLSLVSVGMPMHGTAAMSGDTVVYTPNPGYTGPDSFSYTVDDGNGNQASAVVNVSVEGVNQPPEANDDYAQTRKNTPVVIDVLANDSDPDGDPLTIVEIILQEHEMGFVVINGDGTVTYTPMEGWWGGDHFDYVISDGRGQTDRATVTLSVLY